jgi:GNAT superfamily N-acetyltransferase
MKTQVMYARESLAEVRAANVEALLERHWREIAHYQDIPLNVNWAVYEGLEAAGALRTYTARAHGTLLGYAAYIVGRSPHYSGSIEAVEDVIYVAPEYRRGRVGYQLIAYADEQLAADGVQTVYHHTKVAHNFGPLLERQGYELIEVKYGKRLDRPAALER